MKVAVVTPHPTPYRDPFWNEVARQPDLELDVYYCEGVGRERPWTLSWEQKYRAEILKGFSLGPRGASYLNPGILRRLRSKKYDAIIVGGYNHVTMLMAILHARLRRIPYFIMSEAYLAQPRALWRRIVKHPLVRWVLGNAAGGFPTGQLATDYLLHYGLKGDCVVHVPNVPDVNQAWEAQQRLAPDRDARRAALGLGGRPVILFVGRLVDSKRGDTLLRACREVFSHTPGTLLFLGTGPAESRWKALKEDLNLNDMVRFEGFIQPEELPGWYALADLFVLPSSYETWGAVVVEAAAAGIPVVVADAVGCHPDVVNSPAVGTVVPARDVAALAAAIRRHLENPVTREQVHAAWEPVRARMSYGVIARNMAQALRSAMARGRQA